MTAAFSTNHINQRLADCAEVGDLTQVAMLLAQGADPSLNNAHATRSAAAKGHAECVKLLIQASPNTLGNSIALLWAASYGHTECVELLIPVSDPKPATPKPLSLLPQMATLNA